MMSAWPNWTDEELGRLKSLIKAGKTNPEIAKILGRPKSGVQIKANRFAGGNPNYRIQKTKHAHLRGPAMKYFMTHTWDETRKRFKLTESELKSLFTVGYRDPRFRYLRKETRTHESWSTKELQFLLQHAGLRPRKWIMTQLKRGTNVCHIKERMQTLGIASRNLQGLTLSQYEQAFGHRPPFYLKTDAGPDRGSGHHGLAATHWRIVPWVWLDQEIKAKRLKTATEFRLLISARAMFQEWIFGGNALQKMKHIGREASL